MQRPEERIISPQAEETEPKADIQQTAAPTITERPLDIGRPGGASAEGVGDTSSSLLDRVRGLGETAASGFRSLGERLGFHPGAGSDAEQTSLGGRDTLAFAAQQQALVEGTDDIVPIEESEEAARARLQQSEDATHRLQPGSSAQAAQSQTSASISAAEPVSKSLGGPGERIAAEQHRARFPEAPLLPEGVGPAAEHAKERAKESWDKASGAMRDTAYSAAESTRDAVERAEHSLGETVEAARQRAAAAEQRAEDTARHAKEGMEHAWQSAEQKAADLKHRAGEGVQQAKETAGSVLDRVAAPFSTGQSSETETTEQPTVSLSAEEYRRLADESFQKMHTTGSTNLSEIREQEKKSQELQQQTGKGGTTYVSGPYSDQRGIIGLGK